MTAMFVDCPYCGFLVATDDDGRPLPRCPNCAQRLRDDAPGTEPAAQMPQVEPRGSAPAAAVVAPPAEEAGTDASHPGNVAPAIEPAAITPVQPDAEAPVAIAPQADQDPGEAAPEAASMPVAVTDATTGTHLAATPVIETAAALATDATAAPVLDSARAAATSSAEAVPDSQTADAAAAVPSRDATDMPATAADIAGDGEAVTSVAEAALAPAPTAAQGDHAPHDGHPDVALLAELAQREVPLEAEIEAAGTDTAPIPSADDADATVPAETAAPPEPGHDDAPPPPAPVRPTARRPASAAPAPSFVRRARVASRAPADRRRQALRWAALAGLSLLLVLQLLLADRASLAADARWRPLLASVCATLRCTLPPWREPGAFVVLERDVRAHPTLPGVLRVSARFRNDARWAQPWPALQLTLSDVNGRSVATRLFQPREYLGGMPTQSELGSGQTAAVAMDVIEPGKQAVAFTFDFQ